MQTKAPILDSAYVEDPISGNLTLFISKRPETPDGKWKLSRVNNKFDQEMKRVTMNINTKEKRVSGNDACNQYSGQITSFNKKNIAFGPMASTKRACMVPAKYAQAFYSNLRKVTNYSFDSFGLSLKDSKGNVVLYFSKAEK